MLRQPLRLRASQQLQHDHPKRIHISRWVICLHRTQCDLDMGNTISATGRSMR